MLPIPLTVLLKKSPTFSQNLPNPVFFHGFLGAPSDGVDAVEGVLFQYPSFPVSVSFQEGIEALKVALLDQAGDGPYDFVGYSMGGRLALALALAVQFPELVSSLTLISSTPGLESDSERQARLDLDWELAHRLETEPLSEFLDQWYAQPLFGSLRRSNGYASVLSRRLRIDARVHANWIRTFSTGAQPNYWPFLAMMGYPVHIVVGELDTKYVAIARKMVTCNPNFKLTILPNVGHSVLSESDWRYL